MHEKSLPLMKLVILINVINVNSITGMSMYERNDFGQFSEANLNYSKCCPPNFALLENLENELSCSDKIATNHVQIFSDKSILSANASINPEKCGVEESVECVDFIRNATSDWHLVRMFNCTIASLGSKEFPKCCAPNYAYNATSHSCVRRANLSRFRENQVRIVHVGLTNCPPVTHVIVDFCHEDFIIAGDLQAHLRSGQIIDYGNYCADDNADESANASSIIIRACVPYEEVCGKAEMRCLKKCCPDGEIYVTNEKGAPKCTFRRDAGFNVEGNPRVENNTNHKYGIIIGQPGRKYLSNKNHAFHIDADGQYHYVLHDELKVLSAKESQYCIETWSNYAGSEQYVFLYLETPVRRIKFSLQAYILAVSCTCLLATIILYEILPETQNVHGRAMKTFSLFLLLASTVLCFIQFHGSEMPRKYCVSIGFTIMFAFLGAFAWMNVICFDMWMAFGSMRVMDVKNKGKEHKKFIYYNLYAWGVPITICGFAIFAYNVQCLPNEFIPHIGVMRCYFDKLPSTYDYFIYFVAPVTIMILTNCVFFVRTAVYCFRVKNEIQRMRSANNDKDKKRKRYHDDKEKLIMLLKLFLVMGIPWVFEVITSIFPFHKQQVLFYIETIVDCVNSGQGVIIFCIFILKPRVWQSLKRVFGIDLQRRRSEVSSTAVTNLPEFNGNSSGDHY